MTLPWFDQLGEWNPQLFREIKGRLQPRNILIAVAVSLLSQLLLLISFSSHLPTVPLSLKENDSKIYNHYCTGEQPSSYSDPLCIQVTPDSFGINWQLWWQDVFVWLSVFGVFALLVVGTYMLISDLSKEEHRSTLNFLRLTPQSSMSILTGKLMGVPILLYLVGFLALPLHLLAGVSGQIPSTVILGFYAVLLSSCVFFYSVALLFGLVGNWLGSFQAWLGSGAVLMFLSIMARMIRYQNYEYHRQFTTHFAFDWVMLFAPFNVLFNALSYTSGSSQVGLQQLQWFYLPVGASVLSLAGMMVLNYGLWTYWVWQGLKRCFHQPSSTLLGKQQSYWLTACFEAVILGFALNPSQTTKYYDGAKSVEGLDLFNSLNVLLVFNLLLSLFLMMALSPQRQALQDWARYRHQHRSSRKGGLMLDLIWGERSPALVAVVLNLAIASAMLLPWILLWPQNQDKIPALSAVVLNMSLIFVCAAVAQLMLLMKTPRRSLWAATTVGGLLVLPLVVFRLLSIDPTENPDLWLFSAFSWLAVEKTTPIAVFMAIIGESLVLTLASLQLTRQLRKAGESATKAMLAGRSTVALK